MLNIGPSLGTLALSRDSAFEIPEFKLRGSYPEGTTSFLRITNSAGGELAEFEGTVTAKGIHYLQAPDDVKDIPHGANFQLYVQYPDMEPVCLHYGTVIRTEPRFPLETVVSPEDAAKQFKADFSEGYVGPMWKPLGGKASLMIHTWTAISQAPSLGPNYSLFSAASARWLWPLSMDSMTIVVKVVNVGAGKFNVILCGDYLLQSWIGIQFETGISNNKLHVLTGDGGALSWDIRESVNNTTSNGDVYTIKYNHLLNTIACYKGTSLEPVIEWEDTDNIVPHGEGFRYTGLSWHTSLFTPGVEPTAWEAKDGV
ncbi:hypothetical protein SEA_WAMBURGRXPRESS_24 [Mycobacterium phage Wamburgrxpress]|uniref:LtfC/p132/Gp6 beta-sandwich domain-containing protein n=1 Tax=Mycobacterium phage Wamburgrxpress TaxID=2315617 RepID=A0A386KD29_9CAUD|nr:hypothetical protein [Mycobacterium phage Fezzik]AYD82204.1 hypothetical protein SEA_WAMBURGRXPRESS_24 [Mycobacterium phage Wamburgrxpress]AZS12178.1 hypothetical protein SEA_ACQUIRE49_24 [Mycobacterium phage Acquire49]QGJ92430.1 hypothetical protein SEA_WYATT2_24 [Mycobacterium phage Wyatt2]QGJ93045.1 hypothetical protein SEA_ZARIA_24 [Mycobacterium phage Zaria]QOC56690.1 hypothetical protein SEA_TYSON_24 [Mycobacterium phage Tyson]QWT30553.1 hypothetical protein SEA_ROSE5_24 [Mycobacteri